MSLSNVRNMLHRWAALTLLMLAASLSACHSSSAPTDVAASTQLAATEVKSSQWTTLGTRGSESAPAQLITGQADAKWTDYDPPFTYPGQITQKTQYITMPDGIQLATYVTLPAAANGQAAGPFPTILIQTSYNGGVAALGATFVPLLSALGGADPYFVKHGYAVVVVDVRGTGQSQGVWEAFGEKEQSDYGQVVQWVAAQPWSNGKIGLFGVSYLGITAVITAAQNHPEVKAAFPIVPIGDGYRDIVFTGGQVNPTFIPFWLSLVTVLGVTNPEALTNPQTGVPVVITHLLNAVTQFQVPTILNGVLGTPETAYDGDFWAVRSPLEKDQQITVPTFVVGGLHDLFQRSEPITYERIKHNAPAKLLIGPWNHLQSATGEGLPVDGVPPLNHIALQWFDQYVKGLQVGAAEQPNVTQFVLGHGHYATASDWPHPQAQAQRLYLHGDKSLSTTQPVAGEATNLTVQQPLNGLCSMSLEQWTAGLTGYIPLPCQSDSALAEALDVVYETAPMAADTYINGPIQADLWVATTATDASVSVRVDDVSGSTVTPLTNGLQTLSMRAVDASRSRYLDGQMITPWHPYTQASVVPVGSGNIVKVSVEIFPTSALIKKGHKLRIAVGPSNIAQGLPPVPTLLNSLAGALTIYSDAQHPSSVVIPVVPAAALQ